MARVEPRKTNEGLISPWLYMKLAAPERPRRLTTTNSSTCTWQNLPPGISVPVSSSFICRWKLLLVLISYFYPFKQNSPPPLRYFCFQLPFLIPGKQQLNDRSDLRPRIALGNLLQRVVRLMWLEGSCLFEGVHQKKSVEWPHAAVRLWEPRIDIHIASGNVILMKDKQTFLLLARNV